MGSIDRLPEYHIKDGYLHRVCIPCVYNSGRKATVRATIGRPDVIDIAIETERGRPYQIVEDGYLHLNVEFIKKDLETDPNNWATGYRHQDALEIIEMVKGINKHYFAGTLTVLSDEKAIVDKYIRRYRSAKEVIHDIISAWRQHNRTLDFEWLFYEVKKPKWWSKFTGKIRHAVTILKKQYERVEMVVPLSDAHLGGTWQEFYSDNSWLDEAETLKGGRIYLA
jgi:hypothetical protein